MNAVVQAVSGYLLPCILITMLPGPDTMVVLQAVTGGGRRDGVRAAVGVSIGLVAWSLVVGAGLAIVLLASAPALLAFKLVCCAYLVYLSWRALVASKKLTEIDVVDKSIARPLLKALGTCALNPKLGGFFVAVLPQFIPANAPPGATAMVLVLVQSLVAFAWYCTVSVVASRMAALLQRPEILVWLNRISAAIFLIFAARLFTE